MSDEFIIQTRTRISYIGADDKEFDTESAALRSCIIKRLEEIAEVYDSRYDGFDVAGFLSALVERRVDVVRWLALLDDIEQT